MSKDESLKKAQDLEKYFRGKKDYHDEYPEYGFY
jgi:hypothetical protein